MRRLIVAEFITLDGVIEAPGPRGSVGLRGVPGEWELFEASSG